MADRLERNARTVMILTALSRLTGLIREGVFSRALGTSAAMSAFSFAFLIPNLFRRLFGEGALSAAFLPVYQRLAVEDPNRAAALAGGMVGGLAVGLGLVVVIGEAALFMISSTFDHENVAVWLMMITLPYTPLVCVVAIAGAMLHVRGRFGPTAAAPLILNISLIAAVALSWAILGTHTDTERLQVAALACGTVVLAGLLQVAWSLLALRGQARLVLNVAEAAVPLREVMHRAGPMILGLGVLQLNTLIDGLIASFPLWMPETADALNYPLDESSLATLNFAQRLYNFPLGVFGIAVATAIYPLLTRVADDATLFANTLSRGIRLILFISIPATVGLVLLREPVTAAVLEGGLFDASDSHRVSFVLLGYATCIWAYMLAQICTRAFYARGEEKTPVRIGMSMVALNLTLNLILMWPLGEAGLAWSTACCATVQTAIMVWILQKRGVMVLDQPTLKTMLQTLIGAAIMGFILAFCLMWWPSPDAWFQGVIRLLALTAIGIGIMFLWAWYRGMPEWTWSLGLKKDDSASSDS